MTSTANVCIYTLRTKDYNWFYKNHEWFRKQPTWFFGKKFYKGFQVEQIVLGTKYDSCNT